MARLSLNLLLLGFTLPSSPPDAVLFNRPNQKLLEEILYFLFAEWKPDRVAKVAFILGRRVNRAGAERLLAHH